MKNIFLIVIGIALGLSACVDDYTDANPPSRLDAPTLRISSIGENQMFFVEPVNRFQNEYSGWVLYDNGPIEYTVSVLDAPGKIGAITVAASVPDFGTATLDEASVAALQGQEQGSFKFYFTPNTSLEGRGDRSLNLVVTVSDNQVDEVGESASKTSTLTIPITMMNCFTEGIDGVYVVTEASGNRDSIPNGSGAYVYPNEGGNYTLQALKDSAEVEEIYVLIEEVRPGRFTIDEVTGGVWPVFYPTRANPALDVHLCGNEITSHEDATVTSAGTAVARKFTVNGVVNGDGSINVTWSYARVDATMNPRYPAKGTYKLEKVE